MFHKPLLLINRHLTVTTQRKALLEIYGDFQTLNNTMLKERSAIRTLINELRLEKEKIEMAFSTLEMVKLS